MLDKVHANDREFVATNIAVMTVTDSRTEDTDTSGRALVERLTRAGHRLADKVVVPHNIYRIREVVSHWIVDPAVNAAIVNGGTGLMDRDRTPEAVRVLLDKELEGFGELFRWISYRDIKTSTLASRTLAGVANSTLIFCLPGSTGACVTGWDELIQPQLDYRSRPCNLIELMPRLMEA